jgi:hypothetical protein
MNTRERVLAVLKGDKPDFVPWFGDLDYWITGLNDQGLMPEKYQGTGIFQLHKDLGVGYCLQGYYPFVKTYEGIQIVEDIHGTRRITTVKTPIGDIFQTMKYLPQSYCWGIENYFIKTWRDLKILRYWYEHTFYIPDYQKATDRYELIGENGLILCYLPRSPLMDLVVDLAGITAVTYALMDAQDEFNETISFLENKYNEAAEIALKSPAECLMIPENLSSEVIGKKLFLRYMQPYEEHWIRAIRNAGKYSFIHFDGTLRGLLSEVANTGFDVIQAITPAPVGDIPIKEIRKWTGNTPVVWGGLPSIYFSDLITDLDFDRFVISVLEVMRQTPRSVLGVGCQVPPGARWERIKRVSQLVEQYGSIVW